MILEVVPVGSIKAHPLNPRKGRVDIIEESLAELDQYTPIIVHRSTRRIIAGEHTWKAARKLGWKNIGVWWRDCSDDEALEILLADNNASDKGHTDDRGVFAILSSLPSLIATGYNPEDLTLPEPDFDEPVTFPGADGEAPSEPPPAKPYKFQVGAMKGYIAVAAFDEWRATLPNKKAEAIQDILERLHLIETEPEVSPEKISLDVEAVPIADLIPYPGNPRQGDIGTIMGLLQKYGQWRPVVVNRRNNRILKGNNFVEAADQLGLTDVYVSWVDKDTESEKRIVVVDNRSSDLATYDPEKLGRAVAALDPRAVLDVGFTLDDLDEIGAGNDLKPGAEHNAEATIAVGPLKTKVRLGLLRGLGLTDGQELLEVAAILGIDPSAVLGNMNPA